VTVLYIVQDWLSTEYSDLSYMGTLGEAKTNFVPNRVLGASPPDISPLESLLPRSVHTTLAQLHSGHCRLLNSYKAHITSGISDVCPECGVAPHSIEHLFHCQSHPTQLTGQPSCGRGLPQLDNWRSEKSCWAITTTTTTLDDVSVTMSLMDV